MKPANSWFKSGNISWRKSQQESILLLFIVIWSCWERQTFTPSTLCATDTDRVVLRFDGELVWWAASHHVRSSSSILKHPFSLWRWWAKHLDSCWSCPLETSQWWRAAAPCSRTSVTCSRSVQPPAAETPSDRFTEEELFMVTRFFMWYLENVLLHSRNVSHSGPFRFTSFTEDTETFVAPKSIYWQMFHIQSTDSKSEAD